VIGALIRSCAVCELAQEPDKSKPGRAGKISLDARDLGYRLSACKDHKLLVTVARFRYKR
jgi:hypothetical protein